MTNTSRRGGLDTVQQVRYGRSHHAHTASCRQGGSFDSQVTFLIAWCVLWATYHEQIRVIMSKVTDMLKAWTGGTLGGGGGSVDLSAVNQDIVVVDDHALEMRSAVDADASARLVCDADAFYGFVARNIPASGSTRFVVASPEDDTHYVSFTAGPGGVNVVLHVGSNNLSFTLTNSGPVQVAGDVAFLGDILFNSGKGPILIAPDLSRHRLIVANDGSLSTEPVV